MACDVAWCVVYGVLWCGEWGVVCGVSVLWRIV